ncbi:hypothetical protein N7537_008070 [Penicillium hordei]|uniref:Uncharacterized protein n=1 Tax=Penicillium hordei TaxID=40994 RepID=A0AAD6DZU3_9EURO|nr:uncharacterized protein N7537_008070 [Penicillium hordei]KAJ5597986.1 hypothetical protein N7537_008070 [Penicillium hordei]
MSQSHQLQPSRPTHSKAAAHFIPSSFRKSYDSKRSTCNRNLESLYSRLEEALTPTNPTPNLLGNFQIPDLPFQIASNTDESM